MQGINPGGYYYAVWCRDASYILRDWFLSGHVYEVLTHIYHIWSHQIGTKVTTGETKESNEKVVYGRGSPQANFRATALADNQRELLRGALPTTIYQAGYSEIYGENPDIDSTALMVSTTSWIMSHILEKYCSDMQENRDSRVISKTSMRVTSHRATSSDEAKDQANLLQDPLLLANHLSNKMERAIQYLSTRDVDKDGLLEQGPNEDWMDTALRNGKIVYSQAAWILALKNFAVLLSEIQTAPALDNKNAFFDDRSLEGNNSNHSNSYGNKLTVQDITRLADKAIQSVEKILWSDEENCYIDIHETGHRLGKAYHLLTQDVVLYLVAITENSRNDSLRVTRKNDGAIESDNYEYTISKRIGAGRSGSRVEKLETYDKRMYKRSLSTLDAIKMRVWRGKWPLVTEALLDVTGPWVLKPFQYHNHTFWPWTTGIEMLARSRFSMIEDCNLLLSTLASEGHPHTHAYYEWVNPLNDKGGGAFPFRTGIAEVRIALTDILANIQDEE